MEVPTKILLSPQYGRFPHSIDNINEICYYNGIKKNNPQKGPRADNDTEANDARARMEMFFHHSGNDSYAYE